MGASFSHAPAACEKNNGKTGSHLFFFLLVNDDILHEQRILDDHYSRSRSALSRPLC